MLSRKHCNNSKHPFCSFGSTQHYLGSFLTIPAEIANVNKPKPRIERTLNPSPYTLNPKLNFRNPTELPPTRKRETRNQKTQQSPPCGGAEKRGKCSELVTFNVWTSICGSKSWRKRDAHLRYLTFWNLLQMPRLLRHIKLGWDDHTLCAHATDCCSMCHYQITVTSDHHSSRHFVMNSKPHHCWY